MDVTAVGGRSFATRCLVKYVGRKSGKVYITPLGYADIGGEVVFCASKCASKGGADHHPDWQRSIVATSCIGFQIAAQAFRATWREPQRPERAKVWAFMVDCFPFCERYRKSTTRVPLLVMLKAVERSSAGKVRPASVSLKGTGRFFRKRPGMRSRADFEASQRLIA